MILGAGLDSFAYRRRDLGAVVRVFEVDHPATQQWKRARLRELHIDLPSNLTFVPLDFEQHTLADGLYAGGHRPELPTFVSWLGVMMYLTEAAVFETLRSVASLAPGSEIVFQYVVPEALLSDEGRQVLASIQATLLLDSGGLCSNMVREESLILKAIEKEGLQGGEGDKSRGVCHRHIHDPGIQQEPKTFVTVVTFIALTSWFRVIKATLNNLFRLTRRTHNAVGPAQLTNRLITLHLVDEILDVDLHGWTPVRDRGMGCRQYTPSSHATTLESNKSDVLMI